MPIADYLDLRSRETCDAGTLHFDFDLGGIACGTVTVGVVGGDWVLNRIAVGWAVAMLLAQFARPATVRSDMGLSLAGEEAVSALLGMLYDIRAACDEVAFRNPPRLKVDRNRLPEATKPDSSMSGVVVLSGGIDSSAAAMALHHAGCDLQAVHVRVNRHVEGAEQRAALDVASKLGLPVASVMVEFPDMERIGRHFSRTYGLFPFYNSVPHGRDILLAAIAASAASASGRSFIAFGHEQESRQKTVEWQGRVIHRHDVESSFGRRLLEDYLHAVSGWHGDVFSPLAGVPIYGVRRVMFLAHPELVAQTQSCFWGVGCGQCLKCVSAYAMQRHLGVDVLPLSGNPFSDPENLDMRLFAESGLPSEAIGYGLQMHYCMTDLVSKGEVRNDDYWLRRFEERDYRTLLPRLDELRARCAQVAFPAEIPVRIRERLAMSRVMEA